MNSVLIANILGLISIIVYMISYFRKSKVQIISLLLICNICDIIQYLILGTLSAVSRSAVSFVSNIVFVKWKNKFLVLFFAFIKIILIAINYDSAINIVMMILIIANAISVAFFSEQVLRIVSVCDSFVWMIFDYSVKAYMASIGDIFAIVVIFISYLKYRNLAEIPEESVQ